VKTALASVAGIAAASVLALSLAACTSGDDPEPSPSTAAADCNPTTASVEWGESVVLPEEEAVFVGAQVLQYENGTATVTPTSLGGVVGVDPREVLEELAVGSTTPAQWLQVLVTIAQNEKKVTTNFGNAPTIPAAPLLEPDEAAGTWVVGVAAALTEAPFTVDCGEGGLLEGTLRGSEPIGTIPYLFDCAVAPASDATPIETQARTYCP
jgi:hypothetical protein